MNFKTQLFLKSNYGISESVLRVVNIVEKEIREAIDNIEGVAEINQLKVLKALQDNKLSDVHFTGTTGYGYGDRGREVLDKVYADIFRCEDALVRHQIISGTHAITICLYSVLRPGDELLSITGKPYDTLEEVIGIRGSGNGSLTDFGIKYNQVELTDDGEINIPALKSAVNTATKMVYIQRSRGYNWRPALKIDDIGRAVEAIKSINRNIVILVDNCYGEFVEEREPTEVGADLVAGSLIKNPGGGICETGGYIAGKGKYVELASYRLTSPGMGKKVGATLGFTRQMFQGIFLSPHVVGESLKTAVFCAAVAMRLGLDTSPFPLEIRGDIIQAIKFEKPEELILFCQGIQRGAPVDSFVIPEPWDMPGYDAPVIMAAGTFVQGASIEQSCDAPIKPPYIAYMQGGLVYVQARLGILCAVQNLVDKGYVSL